MNICLRLSITFASHLLHEKLRFYPVSNFLTGDITMESFGTKLGYII